MERPATRDPQPASRSSIAGPQQARARAIRSWCALQVLSMSLDQSRFKRCQCSPAKCNHLRTLLSNADSASDDETDAQLKLCLAWHQAVTCAAANEARGEGSREV
jgi:hypothetical protein